MFSLSLHVYNSLKKIMLALALFKFIFSTTNNIYVSIMIKICSIALSSKVLTLMNLLNYMCTKTTSKRTRDAFSYSRTQSHIVRIRLWLLVFLWKGTQLLLILLLISVCNSLFAHNIKTKTTYTQIFESHIPYFKECIFCDRELWLQKPVWPDDRTFKSNQEPDQTRETILVYSRQLNFWL